MELWASTGTSWQAINSLSIPGSDCCCKVDCGWVGCGRVGCGRVSCGRVGCGRVGCGMVGCGRVDICVPSGTVAVAVG